MTPLKNDKRMNTKCADRNIADRCATDAKKKSPSCFKSLSFGEILWDIINGEEKLGGAPFNVAAHLSQMGVKSRICSSVGDDELGRRAREAAYTFGVDDTLLSVRSDYPTGTASVSLDLGGHPAFSLAPDAAYDHILCNDARLQSLNMEAPDVFIFGTLCPFRSAENRALLDRLLVRPSAGMIFYDINLRMNFYSADFIAHYIAAADVVKLNDEEAAILAPALFGAPANWQAFAASFTSKYRVKLLCLTLGANGCAIYKGKKCWKKPGISTKIADTVGAGDAFSAAFLYTLLKTKDPELAAHAGNINGAFVASHAGAIPKYTPEHRKALGIE